MTKISWMAIVGILCLGGVAWSAPKNQQVAALSQEIQQNFSSADAAAIKKGVADYAKLLDVDAGHATQMLRDHWIALLMEKKHFAEIDQICLQSILNQPQEPSLLEALQLARIRANLAAHQPQRALQQAKGLYNVSSMATTDQAMLVVAECLAAAYPNDAGVVDRFKAQQIAGAQPPGAAPAAAPPAAAPAATTQAAGASAGVLVLPSIHVDDADYHAAIADSFAEDYSSLMGRGNLLLLADHPDPAKSLFERAYAQAADYQLAAASEAIARQIKAHDSVIGRANQWVESIRPKAGNKR